MSCELNADEHLGWRDVGKQLDQVGMGTIKAFPVHRHIAGSSATAISDSLRRDAVGRVIRADVGYREGAYVAQAVETWYGPLGAVVAANGVTTGQGGTTTETFVVDAIGNRRSTQAQHIKPTYHPDTDGIRNSTYNSGGQLTAVNAPYNGTTGFLSDKSLSYDGSGNLASSEVKEMDGASAILWDASMDYYDAADKLRVFNRAIGPYADDENHPHQHNVFEEYRDDALGRRVLMRSRFVSSCSTSGTSECSDIVERTVWDGSQVLMEIRAAGGTSESTYTLENDATTGPASNNYPYGRVAYVHAGGVDQPLAVLRFGMQYVTDPYIVFPHTNWRGVFELGTRADGTLCQTGSTCVPIPWPGASTTVDGEKSRAGSGYAWFGSMLTKGSDGSGLQYLRNRYYDPSTGRFTQEDPIGLAGGMNLYGFASGDPVNFSDPFGLCPKSAGGDGASDSFADCLNGSSGYYANQAATGHGGILNTVLGLGASCGESRACGSLAAGAGALVGGMVVRTLLTADRLGDVVSGDGTAGLRRQLDAHRQKLADYIRDPDAADNKGFLRDASPALRQKIIDSRIRNLEHQIKNFEQQIKDILGGSK